MTASHSPSGKVWGGVAADVLGALYRDMTGSIWPEALQRVAQIHSASWAHIHIDDNGFDTPRLSVPNLHADPGVMERIVASGHFLLDHRPALMLPLAGEIRADWQLIDVAAFDRSPFVNDFLDRPENDHRWSIAGAKVLDSGSRAMFGIARSRSSGPFQSEDVEALRPLAAHVFAAIELHEAIRIAERKARIVHLPGRRLGPGLVAIDRRGRIAFADEPGQTFLQDAKGAPGPGQPLSLRAPRAQDALARALSQNDDHPAVLLTEGGYALKFFSLPEVTGLRRGDLSPVRVLIEVTSSLHESTARLSRREEEVARMVAQGIRIPDIATARGKSIDTIRSQLKAAMRKLGVKTQAQLVRAILGDS